jgi:hypothetical protein
VGTTTTTTTIMDMSMHAKMFMGTSTHTDMRTVMDMLME